MSLHSRAPAYRPDIDGLRALAVIAVVLFHAKVGLVAGGFVGVDVFFVISGYLITGLLLAEQRRDRLSIAGFYHRRILRIFPALSVVSLFCVVAAAVVFPPDAFAQFGRSLVALALFASNLYFDATHVTAGYFDASSQTQLLLHTWSLSVEEQFYIAMPLGLLLLRGRSDAVILRAIAIVAAISFALSCWLVEARPTEAFYVVVPRAWELLVGALIAAAPRPAPSSRAVREAMTGLGLAMILYAIVAFSASTPFPGTAALVPCLGTALVIRAGSSGTSLVGRALSLRPVVAIGLISFSLYLWHWPMLVLVRQLCAGSTAPLPTILALALSFAAAAASYRFVETPFRRGNRLPRRAVLAGGFGTCIVAALLGGAIVWMGGMPDRFDRETLRLVAQNEQRQTDHIMDLCQNWQRPMRGNADFRICGFGGERRKLVVWGDSMSEELQPLLRRLHDETSLAGHGVLFAVSLGCPPALGINRPGFFCDTTNRWSLERAEADDVDAVLIVFAPWWERHQGKLCRVSGGVCEGRLSGAEAETLVVDDLRRSLLELRRRGKQVVLGLPIPDYNLDTARLESQEALLPGVTGALRATGFIPLDRMDYRSLRQRLVALASDLGVGLFDPRKDLCQGEQCTYAEGGVSAYVEGQHISLARTSLFHDSLRNALAGAFGAHDQPELRADSVAP